MKKYIKLIVEDYFNSTEQMNQSIEKYKKAEKKANKTYLGRQQFLQNILGKVTYNKYALKNTFAPIPLSALHIQYDDLYYLFPINNFAKNKIFNDELGETKINNLISFISKTYPNNDIKLVNNGSTYIINTNIVFKTLDDIIDFLLTIKKGVNKIEKSDLINWKPLTIKFRNYLK